VFRCLRLRIPTATIAAVAAPTIDEGLERFGAPKSGIRSLRGATPTSEHVRYLELMLRSPSPPDAVVEVDGEPLAYVVTGADTGTSLAALQRSLVFRADAPYLVELRPGQLRVFSLGPGVLAREDPRPALVVRVDDPSAFMTFTRLFHAGPEEEGALPASTVHDRLFDLLSQSVDQLKDRGLPISDALSLAGRAMFMRFLHDRQILNEKHWKQVAPRARTPESFFASATNAAASCTSRGNYEKRWRPKGSRQMYAFPTRCRMLHFYGVLSTGRSQMVGSRWSSLRASSSSSPNRESSPAANFFERSTSPAC